MSDWKGVSRSKDNGLQWLTRWERRTNIEFLHLFLGTLQKPAYATRKTRERIVWRSSKLIPRERCRAARCSSGACSQREG